MTRTNFLTLISTLLIVQVFLARPCPAVDTILYRYSNPKPANSTGDCHLELYITGTRATGKLLDTKMEQGAKPWNTNITFNGTLTGRWEAGRWLGQGDRNNGRVVGIWAGQAPRNDQNMDGLQTYAASGRIEIFMGSRTNLRVLMGANVLEYNFSLEGRTATVFSPIEDGLPPKPQTRLSRDTNPLPPPVGQTPSKAGSTVRFSSVTREVETSRDGGMTWQYAAYGTVINVGDHVRTRENSTCLLTFSDHSTLMMSPESEVIVLSPPGKGSKWELLFGHLLTNVKKMAPGEVVEGKTALVTVSVKGTTFETSHDRRTGIGRVSVTEGRVEVRHTRTGKTLVAGPGQSVRCTAGGVLAEAPGTPPHDSAEVRPTIGGAVEGPKQALNGERGETSTRTSTMNPRKVYTESPQQYPEW